MLPLQQLSVRVVSQARSTAKVGSMKIRSPGWAWLTAWLIDCPTWTFSVRALVTAGRRSPTSLRIEATGKYDAYEPPARIARQPIAKGSGAVNQESPG